ncbi:MAG: hypothetical protein EXR21_08665 [Flavobacteriaceae bacterium]|nr:hypothetical protein [Flavobacteriaceae bacterium]
MKNSIALYFSLLFVGANAQIINSDDVVVATDRIKVLYIELDNPISIAVPGIKAEKLQPHAKDASLHKQA